MDSLLHFDLTQWITQIGVYAVIFIIFAETGLFLGFFLPGDSLLFTAGLLASQHLFSIYTLVFGSIVAAILGYALAYWIGAKLGRWMLTWKDRFWFKQRYLQEARVFYEKHGKLALILGRLLPIVRTFVPIVAGMVHMPARRYHFCNVVGGLMWAGGMSLLGFFLGRLVPGVKHYLLPIVIGIIVLSILPTLWHGLRQRGKQ